MAERNFLDGIAGGEAEGEAGAHDAGKCRDEDSGFEIEFLDGRALLLFGHFAFFGNTGCTGDENAEKTDADADQNCEAGARAQDFRKEYAAKDGRHESAKGGGVSENHGHAERHAEVAHGETEGEAAESPQKAEDVRPKQAARWGFTQNLDEIGGHEAGENPRGDDPTEEAAYEPVGFPGPAFDAAKGNVETSRREAAEPMEDDAEKRICGQGVGLSCEAMRSSVRDCNASGFRRQQKWRGSRRRQHFL